MEGGACDENSCEAKQAFETSHAVVEIKIKTLDSQDYTCRVAKNVSVPDLKDQIAIITGVPSGSQRLICRGKVLKDEHILSAYDVEDGHTLHLVTRPIPSQSTHAVTDGINGDELDPFSNVSRDQPGHISRSVLVGTFNIPDRGGVILPEINRLFSSVLSTLRVGTSVGANNGSGHGNGSSATIPHNIEENAVGHQQERSNNQPRSADDQSVSRDVDPATDSLSSLHADMGFLGSIPAVSRVRIVQQVVPDALRIASQYVNRMEQVLALTGGTQRASLNLETQASAFGQQTEQQPPPVTGDGDPVAWTSMLRRITDLLSNQSASELRRLADRLEGESSLQTATAHGSILSAGILMERLGHLLLEVGGTMLMLRRDSSHDESTGNPSNPYLISLLDTDSTRPQPTGGRDSRTEIPSEQALRSTYYMDNDDALHNMDIHIHAGLGPYLAARPQLNFFSQPSQDGPPLSLSVDGTTNISDSQDNHRETENVAPSLQDSSSSIRPPPGSVDHGASLRALFSNGESSVGDGATARRGGFYPLFARFQQLSPALFAEFSLDRSGNERREQSGNDAHPSSDRDPVSIHPNVSILHTAIQEQLEHILANAEGGSGGEVEGICPPSQSEEPVLGNNSDTSMRSRYEDASVTNSSSISNVAGNIGLQDVIRPLLHALETPENVQRRDESVLEELHIANEQRSQQGDTDTSLNLKCSAEMEHADCTASNNVVGTGPVILKETTREVIGSEAVVVGLRPDGCQPLLLAGSVYDHNNEQNSSNDLYGRVDEPIATASLTGRTILQDFLSTLASRTDEKSDGEASVDKFPQEWSLHLENPGNHGLHLDSSGSSVVPMNSENNENASDVLLLNESGEDNRSHDCCSNSQQVLSLTSHSSKKRLLLNPEVSLQEEKSATDGRRLLMTTLEQPLTSKTSSNSGDPNRLGRNSSPEASPIVKRQKTR